MYHNINEYLHHFSGPSHTLLSLRSGSSLNLGDYFSQDPRLTLQWQCLMSSKQPLLFVLGALWGERCQREPACHTDTHVSKRCVCALADCVRASAWTCVVGDSKSLINNGGRGAAWRMPLLLYPCMERFCEIVLRKRAVGTKLWLLTMVVYPVKQPRFGFSFFSPLPSSSSLFLRESSSK